MLPVSQNITATTKSVVANICFFHIKNIFFSHQKYTNQRIRNRKLRNKDNCVDGGWTLFGKTKAQ